MLWEKESSPDLCYYDSIRSLSSSGNRVSLEELVRKFDPYRRATLLLWYSQEARCTAETSCLNFFFNLSSLSISCSVCRKKVVVARILWIQ
jgi:hypothetical protein